ncbi:hypothetical protein [Altererythrobacter litoralis]|uniref:Uncharacterized protein n=1 Tax=Altererythrobacter litoralis TaxID=3113904 RepID=A0ABU7GCU5_9SPHN|nr:hypothetical protein [Erythrobacteraceae bacterium 1XM1-14]
MNVSVQAVDAASSPAKYIKTQGLSDVFKMPQPSGQSAIRGRIKVLIVNAFAKRNPKAKNELLRSDIRRLVWPGYATRSIAKIRE